MPEIYSVANQKGGCGKTTGATTFGEIGTLDGKKIILFDLDPNNSATEALGVRDGLLPTIDDANNVLRMFQLEPKMPSEMAITTSAGFDMVIGSYDVADADIFLKSGDVEDPAAYLLDLILDDSGLDQYDIIILDTGGRTGAVHYSAIFAADKVITPCKASALDTKQVKKFLPYVEKAAKHKKRFVDYQDRDCKLAKIYFSEVKESEAGTREAIIDLADYLDDPSVISTTVVTYSADVKNAQSRNKTIVDYRPKSTVTQRFIALYNEIFESDYSIEGEK